MEKKKTIAFSGFSLIELMISLITISCIAAALTPLITKKVTQSGVSVGVGSLTSDCSSKFSDGCILCDNKECFICSEGYELSSGSCTKDCSSLFGEGCNSCDDDECSACDDGYNLALDGSGHIVVQHLPAGVLIHHQVLLCK